MVFFIFPVWHLLHTSREHDVFHPRHSDAIAQRIKLKSACDHRDAGCVPAFPSDGDGGRADDAGSVFAGDNHGWSGVLLAFIFTR